MRVLGWLALACLLAGCAQPSAPAPSPAAAPPAPDVLRSIPIHLSVYAGSHAGCGIGGVCWGGQRPWQLLAAATNESVQAVDLRVGSPGNGTPQRFDWAITCSDGRRDELSRCAHDLANGAGDTPLSIQAKGLDVPAGAILLLTLMVPPRFQAADMYVGDVLGPDAVEGTVVVREVPDAWPAPVTVAVSFNGTSGPCEVTDCGSWPGGTDTAIRDYAGLATTVDLTMTWTPTGPADQRLSLRVSGSCQAGCQEVDAEGTSPLHLHAERLAYPEVTIRIYGGDPMGADPTGLVSSYVAVRTQAHVEGTIVVQPPLAGTGED